MYEVKLKPIGHGLISKTTGGISIQFCTAGCRVNLILALLGHVQTDTLHEAPSISFFTDGSTYMRQNTDLVKIYKRHGERLIKYTDK